MSVHSPFQPNYGATQTVTPTASSATITIGKDCKTLRVRNAGSTNPAYFRTGKAGDGTVTAVSAAGAADMPVYPGETVFIEKSMDHDTLAHISPSGTTLVVTPGEGGIGSGV